MCTTSYKVTAHQNIKGSLQQLNHELFWAGLSIDCEGGGMVQSGKLFRFLKRQTDWHLALYDFVCLCMTMY